MYKCSRVYIPNDFANISNYTDCRVFPLYECVCVCTFVHTRKSGEHTTKRHSVPSAIYTTYVYTYVHICMYRRAYITILRTPQNNTLLALCSNHAKRARLHHFWQCMCVCACVLEHHQRRVTTR